MTSTRRNASIRADRRDDDERDQRSLERRNPDVQRGVTIRGPGGRDEHPGEQRPAPTMNGRTPGESAKSDGATCELTVEPTDHQDSADALRDRHAGADPAIWLMNVNATKIANVTTGYLSDASEVRAPPIARRPAPGSTSHRPRDRPPRDCQHTHGDRGPATTTTAEPRPLPPNAHRARNCSCVNTICTLGAMSDAPGQFADVPLIVVILDALDAPQWIADSVTELSRRRARVLVIAVDPAQPRRRRLVSSQRHSTRTDAPQA